MAILPSNHPFEMYKCYLIHDKKQNRKLVALVIDRSNRTTISYAAYLMSVYLGRRLTNDETVDHINGDKTDDRLDNLQLLSWEDNRKKYAGSITRTMIQLTCDNCGTVFQREKGQIKSRTIFFFCCRECLYAWQRK